MKQFRLQIAGIWLMLLLIYGHLTWVFPIADKAPVYISILFYVIGVISGTMVYPFSVEKKE